MKLANGLWRRRVCLEPPVASGSPPCQQPHTMCFVCSLRYLSTRCFTYYGRTGSYLAISYVFVCSLQLNREGCLYHDIAHTTPCKQAVSMQTHCVYPGISQGERSIVRPSPLIDTNLMLNRVWLTGRAGYITRAPPTPATVGG